MSEDTFRFTSEQLNHLEQKLWQLIDTYSEAENHDFPPVESLLGPDDACDLYAETLILYATGIVEHKEADWKSHPLLEHLTNCTRCVETLKQILADFGEKRVLRHRHGPDVDITIFEEHLSSDEEVLRSAVDMRRPRLISSGFMQYSPDWHYSLENLPQPDVLRPNIRLTLAAPDGNPANIPVTLVLLGQILQGTTDENGETEFRPEIIPLADDPQIPILNVHVHLSERDVV